MKKIYVLYILIVLALASCSRPSEFKVLKWGPEEPIKIGTIPNKQSDGKMGVWIEVSSTDDIGESQVLFDGKLVPTAIQPKLVTAGISPEMINSPGDKKIEIKLASTGQVISVGTLKVTP